MSLFVTTEKIVGWKANFCVELDLMMAMEVIMLILRARL